MNMLTDYIVPCGVILTFIGTVITIYITRKNAKSTKYIDTITSERIKWIEKLRLEVADLNSIFLTIIKNHHFILELDTKIKDSKNFLKPFKFTAQSAELNKEIATFSKTEVLRKINTVRLRLNPVEDEDILECLNILMAFAIGQEITGITITNAWESNEKLISLTQKMLKEEWEKVKAEARS